MAKLTEQEVIDNAVELLWRVGKGEMTALLDFIPTGVDLDWLQIRHKLKEISKLVENGSQSLDSEAIEHYYPELYPRKIEPMSDRANTPWTEDQVKALNEYQESGVFHPYTCGNDSRHRNLVATPEGWKCLDCDYTQDWALSAMTNFKPEDVSEEKSE